MYPLLSKFLIDNLEVLAAVLEQNIAGELEKILTKIKDKELTIKKGNNQIVTIINSKFGSKINSKNEEISNETENFNNHFEQKTNEQKVGQNKNWQKNSNNLQNNSPSYLQNSTKNKIETEIETKEIKGENFSLDLEISKSENDSKNCATASLRAPVGYHLPNAMKIVEEKFGQVFEKFGGHPCAAGFSILPENLPIAKEKLSQIISEQVVQNTDQKNYVDPIFLKQNPLPEFLKIKKCKKNLIWLPTKELKPEIIKEVWQLEPFGQDFEMPQFMLCLTIINSKLQGKKYFNEFAIKQQQKLGVVYTWLGKEQKHLKLTINEVKITIFNIPIDLKKRLLEVDDSKITIWLRTRISQNTWQDATTIELLSEELWLEN